MLKKDNIYELQQMEREKRNQILKQIMRIEGAKFAVHGNMVTAVAKAWEDILATPLNRTFTGDFEEYLPCEGCDYVANCDMEKCKDCNTNIYVAIK